VLIATTIELYPRISPIAKLSRPKPIISPEIRGTPTTIKLAMSPYLSVVFFIVVFV
jgi:hypothetical protein